MKKYIKILGLATIVTIQSCESSERDNVSGNEKEISKKLLEKQDQLKTKEKNGLSDGGSNDTETGDDDEPRKDKSHWRILKDTIR